MDATEQKQFDELCDIIEFGFVLPKEIGDILENGRLDLGDSDDVIAIYRSASKAIEGHKDALLFFNDLTAEKLNAIHAKFSEKFDLENDQIEEAVEGALKLAIQFLVQLGYIKKKTVASL